MWEENGGSGGVGIFKVESMQQKWGQCCYWSPRVSSSGSSLFQLLLAIISTLLLFVAVDDDNDDSW